MEPALMRSHKTKNNKYLQKLSNSKLFETNSLEVTESISYKLKKLFRSIKYPLATNEISHYEIESPDINKYIKY